MERKVRNEPCYCSLADSVIWRQGANLLTLEAYPIPDRIKQIIIAALEAEIAKLDEE